MKTTGIFGGTFNPVHLGHTALAQWLVDRGIVDEVLLTLSPANPLKNDRPGATDADRREMLRLACEECHGLAPSFVEFDLPRPSFTITTLRHLAANNPDQRFKLIIGADNWQIFSRWRDPNKIITEFGVIIYPRSGFEPTLPLPAGVCYFADAPVADVSSSEIRSGLHRDMLAPQVKQYINEHNLYER